MYQQDSVSILCSNVFFGMFSIFSETEIEYKLSVLFWGYIKLSTSDIALHEECLMKKKSRCDLKTFASWQNILI